MPVQMMPTEDTWSVAEDGFWRRIAPRLRSVQKPARYIGGERGAVIKDWSSVALHFAYCFPDVYEIGMSYYGREVLCQQLNARADTLCERAFLPDRDMQALMAAQAAVLWALESKRPLADFDVLGFSLTHELACPSALKLLQLAGLPLRSDQRSEEHPLVIAGGQCMCNPEPVAPFFDVIVNGEGEEVLDEIIDALIASRGEPREQRLLRLARMPGCYVPRFYEALYDESGRQSGCRPLRDDMPARIERRQVEGFGEIAPPVRPIEPHVETPSDKAYIEVMRGCPQGCRFCQAGFITRPARARSVGRLADAAARLAAWTGSDEVGLMSLSTLDHPQVTELVEAVKAALPAGVGVSLPSMRADAMSARLAAAMRRPRETSLTIAIEAGNEAMRTAINKHVSDADVEATFSHLLAAGWHKFKLYFMCGFAAEPLEAVDSIAETIGGILRLARRGGYRRPRLNVSVSVLVPKAHTPLQWQAMERTELTRQKQSRLRRMLKPFGGAVRLSWHDARQAVIEALLSRGGRELADVIEAAMHAGQTLLSDHFDYEVWERLIDEHGIDLDRQVFRERAKDEPLPWDHVDRGVRKDYLWDEWQAYQAGEPTPPCHEECTACGLGCGGPVFSASAAR